MNLNKMQWTIFQNTKARGYLQGGKLLEVRQQLLKVTEELGECTRYAFDGDSIPVEELADVIIPILNIACLQKQNLEQAIINKSLSDVARGVR